MSEYRFRLNGDLGTQSIEGVKVWKSCKTEANNMLGRELSTFQELYNECAKYGGLWRHKIPSEAEVALDLIRMLETGVCVVVKE